MSNAIRWNSSGCGCLYWLVIAVESWLLCRVALLILWHRYHQKVQPLSFLKSDFFCQGTELITLCTRFLLHRTTFNRTRNPSQSILTSLQLLLLSEVTFLAGNYKWSAMFMACQVHQLASGRPMLPTVRGSTRGTSAGGSIGTLTLLQTIARGALVNLVPSGRHSKHS